MNREGGKGRKEEEERELQHMPLLQVIECTWGASGLEIPI